MMTRVAEIVRDDLRHIAHLYTGPELLRGQKGAVLGRLNKTFGGNDMRRYVLAWLFTDTPDEPLSSNQLSEGQWYALWDWIKFYRDEDTQEWITDARFPVEAVRVLEAAVRDYNSRPHAIDPLFPPSPALGAALDLPGAVLADMYDDDGDPEHRQDDEEWKGTEIQW